MNKYFTLIKNEFKLTAFILLVALIALCILSTRSYELSLINNFQEFIFAGSSYWGFGDIDLINPYLPLYNILWLVALIASQHSGRNSKLWYSLPYTKANIYLTKIIYGVVSISLLFAAYTFSISRIYDKYSFLATDTLSIVTSESILLHTMDKHNLYLTIAVAYVLFIAIYFLLSAFCYSSGNRKLGIALGMGVAILPQSVQEITYILFNYDYSDNRIASVLRIPNYFYNFYQSICIGNTINSDNIQISFGIYIATIQDHILRIVICTVITIITFILGYKLSTCSKQTECTHSFIHRWIKVLFIVTVIIITQYFGLAIIYSGYWSTTVLLAYLTIFTILGLVISLIYLNWNKSNISFLKRRKHNEN